MRDPLYMYCKKMEHSTQGRTVARLRCRHDRSRLQNQSLRYRCLSALSKGASQASTRPEYVLINNQPVFGVTTKPLTSGHETSIRHSCGLNCPIRIVLLRLKGTSILPESTTCKLGRASLSFVLSPSGSIFSLHILDGHQLL